MQNTQTLQEKHRRNRVNLDATLQLCIHTALLTGKRSTVNQQQWHLCLKLRGNSTSLWYILRKCMCVCVRFWLNFFFEYVPTDIWYYYRNWRNHEDMMTFLFFSRSISWWWIRMVFSCMNWTPSCNIEKHLHISLDKIVECFSFANECTN